MKIHAANVATPHADRYLRRLCRHFSHKVPANWESQQGEIKFPMGTCYLQASDRALLLRAAAEDNDSLERLCRVIGSHLERFAAGAKEAEELNVIWEEAANG